jgi:hypothetical protein
VIPDENAQRRLLTMDDQGIEHLDERNLLADLMAMRERIEQCRCFDRTCDYCRTVAGDS